MRKGYLLFLLSTSVLRAKNRPTLLASGTKLNFLLTSQLSALTHVYTLHRVKCHQTAVTANGLFLTTFWNNSVKHSHVFGNVFWDLVWLSSSSWEGAVDVFVHVEPNNWTPIFLFLSYRMVKSFNFSMWSRPVWGPPNIPTNGYRRFFPQG
jgi:hypothetical protein